ncbi:hypothetical protein JCM10207_001121 [Rhodosporidiobolus poonsookiae]
MAKGLFAVYRDADAPLAPSSTSTRPSGTINKPSSRRKDGLTSRDGLGRGLKLQQKENVDPFAPHGADKPGLLKGKKPALGAKAADCGRPDGIGYRLPVVMKDGLSTQPRAKPSANGICTGSLRTRVLPDSLFSDDSAAAAAPQVVDIYPSSPRASTSASTAAGECSPSSAVDSGYARSSSGKASDEDLELERGRAFEDEESDVSSRDEPVDVREANRRARALTESPLAEITQAFTGLGGFSNAHSNTLSPSPSPTQPSFSRPALPRTRSSPSKTTFGALPPRMQPYSTTATTKRVKPGQNGAGQPRTAPSRSMRL